MYLPFESLGLPARAPHTGSPADTVPLTPEVSANGEFFRRVFAGATLAYAGYYLFWRWTQTLNPDALWFAVPLALAETFAIFAAGFFVFNVWRIRKRNAASPRAGLSVDVFITTYNEPLDLIRKTAIGARNIRYPHRTYILDDGARDSVRDLAAELGIDYIRRSTNEGAKAGNLNHALRRTSGEYILQLDADHVPLPQILDRMLGYFRDERMAFVQSPQCFYNHDGFTGHADSTAGRYYAEQDIFFNVIQPGKDRHNAAFFCGSCAVIRRIALNEIGGFSTYSITEDFETSLRLHANGWRSAYHAEALAYGLATRTAESFHTQRVRWGRGTLQVWRRFNPLTLRGLTLSQRICYFYSVLVYLDGLPRLTFYAAPLIYLFAGVLPIRSQGLDFLAHFLPLFVASVLLNRLMARGHGAPFWLLERNNLAKVWTHTLALTGYFTKRALRFGVTGKSVGGVGLQHLAPHLLLLVLTVCALLWGNAACLTNSVRYGGAAGAALPFLVNVAWATWNGTIAWLVVRTALRSRERRTEYRFTDALPVAVSDPIMTVRKNFELGHLVDVSATGAAIRVGNPVHTDAQVQLVISLPDGAVSLAATVVRARPDWVDGRHSHIVALAFAPGQHAERDRIARHCLENIAPAVQRATQRQQPFLTVPAFLRRARRNARILNREAALVNIHEPKANRLFALTWNAPAAQAHRIGQQHGAVASCLGLLLLAATVTATPAAAQFSAGYVGAAEFTDNGQQVYLVGGWVTSARSGWSPTANLFAYRIGLPDGSDMSDLWAINPALGVRRQTASGGVQVTLGYTWQSVSGEMPTAGRRVGTGLTSALQADYWGSGANTAQVIASYAWGGAGYTWNRARASHRVTQGEFGALALGAEIGWQGNGDYEALDTGGLVEWRHRPVGLVATAGYRSVHKGAAGSAAYMSLAAVVMP